MCMDYVYFSHDSEVLAKDAATNSHLTKKNSNSVNNICMWALKCKIPQNNYVSLNYFLDLKNGFCLTACSQVYNDIILDGNHTRMDETECWTECMHSFAKIAQNSCKGNFFSNCTLMNNNKRQWIIRTCLTCINQRPFSLTSQRKCMLVLWKAELL